MNESNDRDFPIHWMFISDKRGRINEGMSHAMDGGVVLTIEVDSTGTAHYIGEAGDTVLLTEGVWQFKVLFPPPPAP